MKWTSLQHSGVLFPPDYEPHGVKMLYDKEPVDLTPEQEEVRPVLAVQTHMIVGGRVVMGVGQLLIGRSIRHSVSLPGRAMQHAHSSSSLCHLETGLEDLPAADGSTSSSGRVGSGQLLASTWDVAVCWLRGLSGSCRIASAAGADRISCRSCRLPI